MQSRGGQETHKLPQKTNPAPPRTPPHPSRRGRLRGPSSAGRWPSSSYAFKNTCPEPDLSVLVRVSPSPPGFRRADTTSLD